MSKSIAMKVSAIIGEIGGVAKDGKNSQQNYAYISDEMIKSVIRPLMAKHELMILPSMRWSETVTYATKSGTQMFKTRAEFEFTIICGETGETVTSVWASEADDTGDKSLNKCATAGLKYFIKSLFLIGERDDQDPDHDSPAIGDKKPQPMNAPARVKKPVESAIKVSKVTLKQDESGKPYIEAGDVAFKSRKFFSDAGINTNGWEVGKTIDLPAPVWAHYVVNGDYLIGTRVTLAEDNE